MPLNFFLNGFGHFFLGKTLRFVIGTSSNWFGYILCFNAVIFKNVIRSKYRTFVANTHFGLHSRNFFRNGTFCLFHGKCKEKVPLFPRFLFFFLPHSISNVLTILLTFLSYIGLSYFKKRGRLVANTHLHSKYPFQLITQVV